MSTQQFFVMLSYNQYDKLLLLAKHKIQNIYAVEVLELNKIIVCTHPVQVAFLQI